MNGRFNRRPSISITLFTLPLSTPHRERLEVKSSVGVPIRTASFEQARALRNLSHHVNLKTLRKSKPLAAVISLGNNVASRYSEISLLVERWPSCPTGTTTGRERVAPKIKQILLTFLPQLFIENKGKVFAIEMLFSSIDKHVFCASKANRRIFSSFGESF